MGESKKPAAVRRKRTHRISKEGTTMKRNWKRLLSSVLALVMVLAMLPVSALADGQQSAVPSVSTAADSPVQITKKVTANSDGTYTIDMDAYVTGSVQTGDAVPLDIVLVIDQSGSMQDNLTNLKSALNSFISELSKDAKKNGVDHRVAIVGFAGDKTSDVTSSFGGGYTGYWKNTGLFVNGTLKNYETITTTQGGWGYVAVYGNNISSNDFSSDYVKLGDDNYKEIHYDRKRQQWYYTTSSGRPDQRVYITPKTSANDTSGVQVYKYGWVDGTTTVTSLTSTDYQAALVSVNTGNSVTSSINTAISKLTAGGATYTEYGLKMAKNVFVNQDYTTTANKDREKVVVLFTDGYPGLNSESPDKTAGANAIKEACALKYTGTDGQGATIYTVGQGTDSVTGTLGQFLDQISSNYPAKSATENGTKLPAQDAVYCQVTKDSADLTGIFKSIEESIAADVTVGSTSILKDTVSTYFTPAGVTVGADGKVTSGVKVYKVAATGTGAAPTWSSTKTDITNQVTVKLDGKTVSVTGFDYSSDDNLVAKKNDGWQGNKLIVSFNVTPDTICTSWDGTKPYPTNDTNNSKAGLYYKDNDGGDASTALTTSPTVDVTTYSVTYKQAANTNMTADVVTSNLITGQSIPAAPTNVTANTGYTLGSWALKSGNAATGGKIGTSSLVYELTVNENSNVTINYVASPAVGGSVSKTSESLAPATGTAEGSTATASTGYTFVNWTDSKGNVVSTDATFKPAKVGGLNVAETYTANFTENGNVTINYVASPAVGGNVSKASESLAPATGTAQGSTATANTGYHFVNWTKNGTQVSTDATYTPSKNGGVYENATYTANFAPNTGTQYTILYYRQNTGESYYCKEELNKDKIIKYGTTGERAKVVESGPNSDIRHFTGFTYDKDNKNNVKSGEIAADGSLILKMYYTRNSYAVKGTIDNGGTVINSDQSVLYGNTSEAMTFTAANGYRISNVTVNGVTPTGFTAGDKTYTYDAVKVEDNITVVVTTTALGNVTFTYKAVDGAFADTTVAGTVKLNETGATAGATASESGNPETWTPKGATATANAGYEFAGWFTKGTGNNLGSYDEVTKNAKLFDGMTLMTPRTNQTFYAKFVPTTGSATVTFKVVNGTWADGTTADKTETVTLIAGKGTLGSDEVPTGMKANANYEGGSWDVAPNTAENAITGNVTYTYTFAPKELVPNPGLTVEKKLTGVNNKTYEDYTGKVEVGDKLTWTITVKNTGNVELNNIYVKDEFTAAGTLTASDFTNGIASIQSLAVDASQTFTVTYTVLKSDANTTIVNKASAGVQKDDELAPPMGNDTSRVEVKKIEEKVEGDADLRVEKTVSDKNPKVGDTITYTIVVTNTGEADLWNVRISDDFDGNGKLDFSEKIPYLGEGMSKEFTYTYKVVEADRGEKLTNRVTARGETDGGQTPSDTDKVVVTVDSTQTPANAIIRPSLNARDHVAYIIGYVDGTVRPENDITRSEVAAIFFRLLTDDSRALYWSQYNTYSDVSADAWYNNAVSTLSNAGIITGYTDGTFRPDQPITRAEFAAISARFSDVVYGGTATFPDVPANYWAYKYISLAQYLGWVQGMPDGNFYPAKNITRAEAITMINRVLDRDVEKDHMLGDMVTWTDNTPDKWYYEAVQEATNSHLYSRTYIYATGQDFFTEIWRAITENPDWAALERAWSTANSK